MRRLRVIDFGDVSALHSQTLWHAIGFGVSEGAPPTLAFQRPTSPYVSVGLHRSLTEVDRAWCARRGLPVFRRQVGGGPVYVDPGQLFFQIVIPAADAPAVRARAVRTLLAPAVAAFRDVGIDAHIDELGEVVVGDRKICGHGAGQIGGAILVVGNLILTFDHAAAAASLAAPHPQARAEAERLMRRYVSPTPADPTEFIAAATAAYAAALDADVEAGSLTDAELAHLARLDVQFADEDWLADHPDRAIRDGWLVKIRAGVWVGAWRTGSDALMLSSVDGRIVAARIDSPALNGSTARIERSLVGATPTEAADRLASMGPETDPLTDLIRHAPATAPM